MGKTQVDDKTGINSRLRTISMSSGSGSGDEMSSLATGPFARFDFKQHSVSASSRKVSQGCDWQSKGAKAKTAAAHDFGSWGATFKNEDAFKQMHWC